MQFYTHKSENGFAHLTTFFEKKLIKDFHIIFLELDYLNISPHKPNQLIYRTPFSLQ